MLDRQPVDNSSSETTTQPIDKSNNKPNIPIAFIAFLIIAIAFILFNVYSFLTPVSPIAGATNAVVAKPILLSAQNCVNCFPLDQAATQIFQNFDRVSYADSHGKDLVTKYSIAKLPALIIFDPLAQSNPQLAQLLVKKGDAFVLEAPSAPFYDIASQSIKGIVTLTSITPLNCSKCTAPSNLADEFKQNKVSLVSQSFIEGSEKANELIAKYNLSFLPAFILTHDLLEYPTFKRSWNTMGSIEPDGTLVMRLPLPPYKNISTQNIEGLVSVTYLSDTSCTACYNVSVHRAVLKGLNVHIENETFVDVSSPEGTAILAKYNVTAVPTILLSKEANVYFSIKQVWATVGSTESDGVFVFRNLAKTPGLVYKNLTTGQILNSTSPSAT